MHVASARLDAAPRQHGDEDPSHRTVLIVEGQRRVTVRRVVRPATISFMCSVTGDVDVIPGRHACHPIADIVPIQLCAKGLPGSARSRIGWFEVADCRGLQANLRPQVGYQRIASRLHELLSALANCGLCERL